MGMSTSPLSLPQLRRELRSRRRAVGRQERRAAGEAIRRLADRSPWLARGSRIGLFLPMPEEIDTAPLRRLALARGCRLYLPRVIDYDRCRLLFLPEQAPLRRSRYGIMEPVRGRPLRASQLDVVFVPLVGFDDACNRIGMGKGYYDRALAFRRHRLRRRRPLLLGVAFDCQHVPCLPVQPHDVPLDALLTPGGLRTPRRFDAKDRP